MKRWTCWTVATVVMSGCGSLFGSGDTGQVRVRLSAAPDAAVSADVSANFESAEGAVIRVEDVTSLLVTVTRIEFQRVGTVDAEGAWEELSMVEPLPQIDLADLAGNTPMTIAQGELTVGDYSMLRLFVNFVSIQFASDVTLGQSLFEGGIPHGDVVVDIPSGDQTGIKTNLQFSVDDSPNDVELMFDATATYANITATGNGRIKFAPVIRQQVEPVTP